jgi:hypothetical protein
MNISRTSDGSISTNFSMKIVKTQSIGLDISSDDLNRQFVCRIQESEVKDALKRMKGGKVMGSDVIPIEVRRTLGDLAIV